MICKSFVFGVSSQGYSFCKFIYQEFGVPSKQSLVYLRILPSKQDMLDI